MARRRTFSFENLTQELEHFLLQPVMFSFCFSSWNIIPHNIYSQTSVFDQSVYHFTSFSDLFKKIILRFSYTISVILQVKERGKSLDKLTMPQIYIRETSQLSRFTSFFDLLKISKKWKVNFPRYDCILINYLCFP